MFRRALRRAAPIAPGVLLVCAAALAQEQRVELIPARAPPWRASRFFESLRDDAHAPRALLIETRPAGAQLELAYLRDGVELRRASGAAPLAVDLPSTLRTGDADRIAIRAALAGHVARELSLPAPSAPPKLEIALTREPARLLTLTLLELADHARLELRASRELVFRFARSERGWRLVLSDATASGSVAESAAELRGATISRATLRPAGADLMLEFAREGGADEREIRLSQRELPMRDETLLAIEWIPRDGGRAASASAARALARLARSDLSGCAQAFERSLRAALGAEQLARSLSQRGDFREEAGVLAIERLAALAPDGRLQLADGARIPLASAAERERVLAQPERVHGLLLALRALASGLAPSGTELRGLHAWLAPERPLGEFTQAIEQAAGAEADCRARP